MIHTYNPNYRGPCRSERMEQIDAISWLEVNHPDRWPLIFHCPNESRGTPLHMQMRAKEGVKPGVPDIIDAGAVRGFFELKRLDSSKSRLSPAQREFLQAAADSGAFAAVCYGFEAFKQAYGDYLEFVRLGWLT
ncbi:VRR-NUC domain-containing protein [Pseudomonas sp.]|uniref:VRR-NUC domain-containing protein n=1 Tax=Pseudomonas sp. TaxID=306 RepID=UPI00258FEF27|nr:VRR-NUC domain-containing protein [Pseudomonas sp.]